MNLQQAYFNISGRIPVEDIKVRQRLDRGYDIVRLNGSGYSLTKNGCDSVTRNAVYKVEKASTLLLEDNSVTYTTSITNCTCPDFEKCRAGLCKHRLAIMLLTEMEKE